MFESKPFKSSAARKFLHRCHGRASRARETPVAACMTKAERQPPAIKAGTSSSMHPPPTLARGPTGKAVMAFEMRSRTLPYAPVGSTGMPRGGTDDQLTCTYM